MFFLYAKTLHEITLNPYDGAWSTVKTATWIYCSAIYGYFSAAVRLYCKDTYYLWRKRWKNRTAKAQGPWMDKYRGHLPAYNTHILLCAQETNCPCLTQAGIWRVEHTSPVRNTRWKAKAGLRTLPFSHHIRVQISKGKKWPHSKKKKKIKLLNYLHWQFTAQITPF